MNHLNLYYQLLQHHNFQRNIYEHLLFLKLLHYQEMVVYFVIFDVYLIF